ncbi:MAG: Rpn family recombination-promoting nuclease/putative transposase [Lachnospiraceae bacterium]|nr:Rpn family recombination-promoting nuclease/putative transposase [Lachnospiraceae bacterium]
MGLENNALHDFLRNKRRFADFFNGILFDGKEVVRPEHLKEGSEKYDQPLAENRETKARTKTVERIRDLKMLYEDDIWLRVLGIEALSEIDLAAGIRGMEYDLMEYRKQIKELQDAHARKQDLHAPAERMSGISAADRLKPVYTVWFYHGQEAYTGPRSLQDMVQFPEGKDLFRRYFSDYRLNLVCLNEIRDMDVFRSEIRVLFKAMECRGDRNRLRAMLETDTDCKEMDADTLYTMSVMMHRPGLWNGREKYLKRGEGEKMYTVDMMWADLENDIRQEGMQEGMILSDHRHGDSVEEIAGRYQMDEEEVRRILSKGNVFQVI